MSTSTNHSQFGSSSEGSMRASSPTPPPFDTSFYVTGQADLVWGQPFLAFGQRVQIVPTFEQPNQSDIDDLMPKLCSSDYYTKPTIQELAAKERAIPGYCCRVKNFVVGRHGVGSVRFIGETDVRRVDLEYFIRFIDGWFIYRAEKPPDGQGYNKTTEVTMLVRRVSCQEMFSCDIRARIVRHVEGLKKMMDDQGMEYVSYDPIKGEIKFRVKYFSGLGMILFKLRRASTSPVTRMLRRFVDRLYKLK